MRWAFSWKIIHFDEHRFGHRSVRAVGEHHGQIGYWERGHWNQFAYRRPSFKGGHGLGGHGSPETLGGPEVNNT